MDISNKNEITKECIRLEEDCSYSSKGHYENANIWSKIHLILGIPIVVISAFLGVYASQNYDWKEYILILVAILAALQTFLKADEKNIRHKNSGDKFKCIKDASRILRTIEINQLNEQELITKLNQLRKEYDSLNQLSLQINTLAYKKARKGIKEGQAHHSIDEDK